MKPFNDVLDFDEDRDRLVKQFQTKLLNRSMSELSTLVADRDVGTALQAAYSKASRLKASSEGGSETAPDPLDAWFLGFVEGRLCVDIPAWWTAESCGFQLTEVGWEPNMTPRTPMKYGFPTAVTESGFGARMDVQSRVVDGKLDIANHDKTAHIPLALFGRLYPRLPRDLIDLLVDRNRAFVGLYQVAWSIIKVRVVCMTYPGCWPLWGAQTFTMQESSGKSGARSLFEMRMSQDDTLCVFSTEFQKHSSAIDGFSRKDGK